MQLFSILSTPNAIFPYFYKLRCNDYLKMNLFWNKWEEPKMNLLWDGGSIKLYALSLRSGTREIFSWCICKTRILLYSLLFNRYFFQIFFSKCNMFSSSWFSGSLLLEEIVTAYDEYGIESVLEASQMRFHESRELKKAGSTDWWRVSFWFFKLLRNQNFGLAAYKQCYSAYHVPRYFYLLGYVPWF